MYFLVAGDAGCVLPRFENKIYLDIKQGQHFGHVDLGEDKKFVGTFDPNKKRKGHFTKELLIRRFTVQSFGVCELLALSIKDLLKMKFEFPKLFDELFSDVR